MDEQAIKAEIRLWALECVVSQLWATIYQMAGGDPLAHFEKRRKALLESARRQTFPNLDPAMSDLVSAELEAAVDALLGQQKELLERDQARQAPSEPQP
jgi:hypothetical protein